jgi:hypothetical protein
MPCQQMWVTHRLVRELELALSKPITSNGKGEVIFDNEVVFPNGFRMAIQVIAAETKGDTAWTQGVLFDENGNELGNTDVGESFLGEYCVYYEGAEYTVNVLDSD